MSAIRWLALAGILLSVYTLHVEHSLEGDAGFVAACDLAAWVSCTRVFSSPYARGFGLVGPVLGKDHFLNLPNAVIGLAVYAAFFATASATSGLVRRLRFWLAVACCLGSVYLAYILAVVLGDVCIVCVSTYVVNAGLLYATSRPAPKPKAH